MGQVKVCPLRVMASETGEKGWGSVNLERSACVGPACAWYDAARECCAVLALVRGLRIIG